ncbi:MAG TPA: ORF6N domain-containing protein [Pyrinomonadaceae bacterium]|nr:ORF6N domain-containing protein [Pyrinomonadaceae bacterium]
MREEHSATPIKHIEKVILVIRGVKVILDSDLAALYGVTTARLNEQVKRNLARFPADFAFRLTTPEFTDLMSQIATSSSKHGGRRKPPLAFTEHGAIMAANVLNSKRAVQASVQVVRAFIRLRQMLASHSELSRKLVDLENKYDAQFAVVFDAIRQLMKPASQERKQIGFTTATKK